MQDYEYAGLQRQLAFRAAQPRAGARRDPGRRRCGGRARRRRKLFRYPGLKEDYYLADFDRGRRGPRRARGRTGTRARGRPPAARDFRLSRPTTRSTRRCSTGSPPTSGRVAVVIPRTEGQAEAVRARGDAVADRPRARDRRPEPDRLRRPRGQRRRDDEPRGRRARHARLHDLQRPHGRRRRAADRRGPAAPARRPGGARARQAHDGPGRRATRATRSCWSRQSSASGA